VKKFKKAIALSLSLAMGLSLAACGDKKEETTTAATTEAPAETTTEAAKDTEAPAETTAADTEAPAETTAAAPDLSADGKVLNIYCWNEEFKSRLTDHYPGYEKVDDTTGKIGDITVKFNITPSENNAYQNNLDATLKEQADAADDDKIDLFLVEADYALKYVNTDFTMPVADLGITDAELADQYQYTKDVVTSSDGALKGVSWQGCPGVLIYNRAMAKEVFGSDDPAEVQKNFSDWGKFKESAKTLKEKGYYVNATVNDAYRVFSNNVSTPWVVDGKITIDPALKDWVDMSKELVDAGETTTEGLWSDTWNKGFMKDSDLPTFSYFGPAWLIDFCMAADNEASIAHDGGWAATEGPQGFYWGGTWICAATGTDNPALVADIMRKMTCDADVMKSIVTKDNDFVNNKPTMEAMAADTSYGDAVLGGQNALAMFCAGADKIDLSNISVYDQGCNEKFQQAMKNYFEGTSSYDEALNAFYTDVETTYPELSH